MSKMLQIDNVMMALVLGLVNSGNDSLDGGGVPIMIGISTSSLFQMLLILWKTSMRLKLVLNGILVFSNPF